MYLKDNLIHDNNSENRTWILNETIIVKPRNIFKKCSLNNTTVQNIPENKLSSDFGNRKNKMMQLLVQKIALKPVSNFSDIDNMILKLGASKFQNVCRKID